MQHRVEFDDSSFLSGHSDLLCLSFEILQITQDGFLGGLISGTVQEDYFPASDTPGAQDVRVDHVLHVGLDGSSQLFPRSLTIMSRLARLTLASKSSSFE